MNDRLRSMDLFLSVLLCIFFAITTTITIGSLAQPVSGPPPQTFTPVDNFLIDCGATNVHTSPDGRIFKSDAQSSSYVSAKDVKQISTPSNDNVPSPIYLTARIFTEETTYSFTMSRPGWHWIRLHFFPMNNSEFDLTKSSFSVATDELVLLHSFCIDNSTQWAMKEYIVNVTKEQLNIKFSPMKNSFAYVNAIEVVSAPDILISDLGSTLIPVGDYSGLSTKSYQTVYRLNMGGPRITPSNDTLGRFWDPDTPYLKARALAKHVSVSPGIIKYPADVSPLIAPNWIYSTAVEMADSRLSHPNFNVTWGFEIDPAFGYMIRLHFCDIVSKSLNDLYFNVYINGHMAISGLDLSSLVEDLATPYFRDFVTNASDLSDMLRIEIGPFKQSTGAVNAIINGVEVFKMSNSVGSFDGEFGVHGAKNDSTRKTVAAVGFGLMFGAFVGLGAMVLKWYKRPHDWERSKSFSSWLLPLHAGNSTFMTSKHSIGSNTKSGYNFYSSTMGLGRYFSFAELQEATKNFDQNAVIGVGGFGNVYIGDLDDGTKVAVKRGNPQSEQGITEFQTEIQMLSKLRHRHLVSLIGYCDENEEMILVYEYMSNGPLRDHLYGKDLTPLSWKQRLEICIGSARGLHYLHTGAAQGIIHRDVKTTNILLDENFVAKMSDFGLSKNAPTMEQGHVSTAVKGSFGYLDPEYFRRQQLTDKSDVYSFGVVLFEVLCARPAINPQLPREQVNLAEWAMQWKRKGLLDKIVDPVIANTISPESMKKFAEAAEKCLAEYGVDRPSMGDVLWNLEYALQLQESFLQQNAEEENKAAVAPSASSSLIDDPPHPLATEEEMRRGNPPQVNAAVAEHSGTAMFSQISEISGR
ncbi:hypothetical protein MKW98_012367 [Papaver atlanticum]|uniref:Protein kinase domain-containing protein n=1 Tax=Papaver atlanticum TaxID=357466 RepID=A0AAD4SZB9_9MAGN|nr:hypothetical protein MKW98_012367 [Papaver atlanticum]